MLRRPCVLGDILIVIVALSRGQSLRCLWRLRGELRSRVLVFISVVRVDVGTGVLPTRILKDAGLRLSNDSSGLIGVRHF